MPWNLENRVAVVTGASCGLGQSVFKRLAQQHNMKVACLSRKPFSFELPPNCTDFKGDICNSAECDEFLKEVRQKLGPVSVLVNCAGVTQNKLHLRTSDEDYDSIVNTNLRGALNITRSGLRFGGLLQSGSGSVVHIGSVVGVQGNQGQVLYAASKAALTGAVKSWSKEYGSKNIRFNVVSPGLMEGEGMGQTLTDAQREQWKKACALGRLASVEDVADVVESVIQCTFINGQNIVVDGGSL